MGAVRLVKRIARSILLDVQENRYMKAGESGVDACHHLARSHPNSLDRATDPVSGDHGLGITQSRKMKHRDGILPGTQIANSVSSQPEPRMHQ